MGGGGKWVGEISSCYFTSMFLIPNKLNLKKVAFHICKCFISVDPSSMRLSSLHISCKIYVTDFHCLFC